MRWFDPRYAVDGGVFVLTRLGFDGADAQGTEYALGEVKLCYKVIVVAVVVGVISELLRKWLLLRARRWLLLSSVRLLLR